MNFTNKFVILFGLKYTNRANKQRMQRRSYCWGNRGGRLDWNLANELEVVLLHLNVGILQYYKIRLFTPGPAGVAKALPRPPSRNKGAYF